MKRIIPILLLLAVLCTGCHQTEAEGTAIQKVILDSNADSIIRKTDGYVYLEDTLARSLDFQILIPKALGLYEPGSAVKMSDPSGKNLMVFEYRLGDSSERCYQEYLHNVGCSLTKNRIRIYDPDSIGRNAYPAYHFDARLLTGDEDEERMISYWFIDKPATELTKQACYIVIIETTEENLDTMMCCIQSFITMSDYTALQKEESTE